MFGVFRIFGSFGGFGAFGGFVRIGFWPGTCTLGIYSFFMSVIPKNSQKSGEVKRIIAFIFHIQKKTKKMPRNMKKSWTF